MSNKSIFLELFCIFCIFFLSCKNKEITAEVNNSNCDTIVLQYNLYKKNADSEPDKYIPLIQNLAFKSSGKCSDTLTASIYNYLGGFYVKVGLFTKSFELYSKSLKIYEKLNDTIGQGLMNLRIGQLYYFQDDVSAALIRYRKSKKLYNSCHNQKGIASALFSIGTAYWSHPQPPLKELLDSSKIYLSKSLLISQSIFDTLGIARANTELGEAYNLSSNHKNGLTYFIKGYTFYKMINDKRGILISATKIANNLFINKEHARAKPFIEEALMLSDSINDIRWKSIVNNIGANLYEEWKEFEKATICLRKWRDYESEFENTEARLNFLRAELNAEFKKQEALNEEKHQIEISNKRNQQISLVIVLVLLLVFFFLMYRRFKIIQKQKHLIENQKEILSEKNYSIEQQKNIIEEKHKEIKDSINYAERIQRSLLASNELLNENLKEHFVFFQPKDVVSGDFYWANEMSNGCFVLVTADSTGHGVPWAIMSILNISCLKETVKEGYIEPSDILNHTRTKIIEILKKDGSTDGGKDGMDCSLISFNFKKGILTYSAANNPVWIVRDKQVLEFVSDKMPVGKHVRDSVSFTQHMIELQKGDMVYALTDGLPDQFGGPKGKKFLYKQLKDLLISISHLSIQEQKDSLANALHDWKGDLEQVDDVSVIGIRI